MALQLAVEGVHSCAVLLLSGNVVKLEKGSSGADVVQGEVGFLVLEDGAGGVYDGVIPGINVADNLRSLHFASLRSR